VLTDLIKLIKIRKKAFPIFKQLQTYMATQSAPVGISSIWSATANQTLSTQAVGQSASVDVVVVGAGYLGLCTALSLAEGGARVMVLEQGALGGGASGLNGGQVIPGVKPIPSQLVQLYGAHNAERVVAFANGSADTVFGLIAKHHIDCDAVRTGWIQPAVSARSLKALEVRASLHNRWGGDAIMLDAKEVQTLIGNQSGAYCGGWMHRSAGCVHPLNYLLGLVRAAQQQGVLVCTHSRVSGIRKEGAHWQVHTASGPVVRAEQVVLATNAYSHGLWPGLQQTVVAANSLQIATAPLADGVLSDILPKRQAVSDGRRVMNYYRRGPQGRILFGGRGPFVESPSSGAYHDLIRAMHALFPQLRDVPIEFHWSGKVALTRDYLPHIHRPSAGLWAVIGCNGRGVGLMSALGSALGKQIQGHQDANPFLVSAIERLPLHQLNHMYAGALIQYYRLLDQLGQ